MPATYEPIATTTLGSSVTNFSFTSIPSGYTDLRLSLSAVGTSGGSLLIQVNTGVSTSQTVIQGSTATSTPSSARGAGWYAARSGFSLETQQPSFIIVDIFNYSSTSTFKTALGSTNNNKNGTGIVNAWVGLAQTTSAITSIKISEWTGTTIDSGTTATLYGILKA